MLSRSSKMNTLQVPLSPRYAIQPMNGSKLSAISTFSDDDDEGGLGYQNTLVSKMLNLFVIAEYDIRLKKMQKIYRISRRVFSVHVCFFE